MQVFSRRQSATARISRLGSVTVFVFLLYGAPVAQADAPPRPDAQRAFGYLKQICKIGPRISGTEGMVRQREILQELCDNFDGLSPAIPKPT